ncbi:MAG: phosphatidate cytidylyltransferase [Actinobacteria bacterium]|uniref:phosphatidate cytidylyltransferase n=1 Tax=Ferrimicrobium sp. TaxID=2926050 RepID=UPI002603BEEE|nr:phosphatidate cytidylyltransferase [Ferrimicrobium sp.]MCL5974007.1 phosphatidate cytidylyltransferase [Actinomycetota bacterium]
MGEEEERHRRGPSAEPGGSLFDDPASTQDNKGDDDVTLMGVGDDRPNHARADEDVTISFDASDITQSFANGDWRGMGSEDRTVELPSWREPATGEIPRILEELAGEPLPRIHERSPDNFDALEDREPLERPGSASTSPGSSAQGLPGDDTLAEVDDFIVPVERVRLDDADRRASPHRAREPEVQMAQPETSGGEAARSRNTGEDPISKRKVAEPNGGDRIVNAADAASPGVSSSRDGVDAREPEVLEPRTRHEVVSSRRRVTRDRTSRGANRMREHHSNQDQDHTNQDQTMTPDVDEHLAGVEAETPAQPLGAARAKAVRSITGIVLAAIFLGALKLGVATTLVAVTIAVVTAAAEGYNLLRKGGYRPAAFVGLLAVIGLVVGAYLAGEDAIVIVMVASIVVSLVWFMVQHRGANFVVGVTTTMVMVVWVGLFGAFAGLLLRSSLFGSGGLGLLVGTLLCATSADVFAFFGGSLFGKHKLAPAISPGKTIEGALIGGLGAIAMGGLFVPLIHPFTLTAGLALGVAAAIIAPIGDLAESALKRSVSVKDSSRLLPGHGGMLDRIDGILIVLPVAFYLFLSLHLR